MATVTTGHDERSYRSQAVEIFHHLRIDVLFWASSSYQPSAFARPHRPLRGAAYADRRPSVRAARNMNEVKTAD